MTPLVAYLLLFVAVGVGFIFVHLVAGKLLRPNKPGAEKQTIYECGEPTIGSAWIQFDLRFYVVALLFVIFDVEVAFFFPWAEVFGKANALQNADLPAEQRLQMTRELSPTFVTLEKLRDKLVELKQRQARGEKLTRASIEAEVRKIDSSFQFSDQPGSLAERLDNRLSSVEESLETALQPGRQAQQA